MSAFPKRSPATYADLEAVPENLVAEILGGELVTHPRPAPKHAVAASLLGGELDGPFRKGRGGPGGWLIVDEPELHFECDVVVPNLAGWKQERFSGLPETAYFTQAPDWVCEVLSPSTERYDRGSKRSIYARARVPFLWLLDPRAEILETFALRDGNWTLTGTFGDADEVIAPPFDAVGFKLSELWPFSQSSQGGARASTDT